MNKILMTALAVLASLCVFFGSPVYAADQLTTINNEVEAKAQQLDDKYGVLLTVQELNDLKIALVVRNIIADTASLSEQALAEKAQQAIVTYEITDPTNQRKLLIEMAALLKAATTTQNATGDGNGNEPPSP